MAGDSWSDIEIGHLGEIFTGRTPPTEHPSYFGPDFPFITPGDMHQGKFARRTERSLSLEGATLLRRIRLPPNSVCVSCIGWQMGEVIMTDTPSFSNQQINTIIPNGKIDPSFLYYSLRPRKQELLSLGSGTGARTPILNKSAFSALKVKVPPLPVQRRISSILGSYDDLIEINRRRVAILEEMARGLFDEWFVRFRFPGHEGHSIIETDSGDTPNGWKWSLLGDVADVNAASIRPNTAPERISYIDIASVSRGDVRTVQPLDFADAPGRARRKVRDGSIIWSMVRPNLRSYALIISPHQHVIASTGFAVLDSRSVPFSYLYHWVTTENFIGYLSGNTTGAAYPAVTPPTFERAAVLVPSKALLVSFNAAAEPILRLTDTLRRTNLRLGVTRDLLLPRLLSGDLNLAAAERELEVAA